MMQMKSDECNARKHPDEKNNFEGLEKLLELKKCHGGKINEIMQKLLKKLVKRSSQPQTKVTSLAGMAIKARLHA